MNRSAMVNSLGDAMRLSMAGDGRGLICWGPQDGWCQRTHGDLRSVLDCRRVSPGDRLGFANDGDAHLSLPPCNKRVEYVDRFIDDQEASGVEAANL